MKIKTLVCAFIISALVSGNLGAAGGKQDPAQGSDGEVIAFMTAVDNHEIAAANIALSKNPKKEVADYADEMKTDHNNNLTEMEILSKDEKIRSHETLSLKYFKLQGERNLKQLNLANSNNINKKYIDAMIRGHKEVLKKIDAFIKKVDNSRLKKVLAASRQIVNVHLNQAKAIQQHLEK